MASNSYSDHHWIHFTNRHKRELGHAPFHSNGNSNGKEAFIDRELLNLISNIQIDFYDEIYVNK